jgi:general secretion pathway protein J
MHPTASARASQTGFTLLELLVATAIFAVMAALAYAGLGILLQGRATLEDHLARLKALQQTYVVMQRDVTQTAAQTGGDALGGVLPALRGEANGTTMALTRAGYPNPANIRRSHLLRVRYQLDGTQLHRLQWTEIDRAPGDKPEDTVLLDGVDKLVFGYRAATGKTYNAWPPAGVPASALPRAVRITLELRGMDGPIHWLFTLP